MNKTLSTFMGIAAIMLILSSLYYGIVYQSLLLKHDADVKVIEQFQINKQ